MQRHVTISYIVAKIGSEKHGFFPIHAGKTVHQGVIGVFGGPGKDPCTIHEGISMCSDGLVNIDVMPWPFIRIP